MKQHINLRVTHRLLWRLYAYRAVVSLLSGLGILMFPDAWIGFAGYQVITDTIPPFLMGILWLASGIMIAGGLITWPYKTARVGIAISIILYFLWGTGIWTNQVINQGEMLASFAVLAYYSLALTSYFMLLEPPINPATAITDTKNKQKDR